MEDALSLPLPAQMPDLSGQVALITGTTSGLGRRFAWLLGKAGAKVALTGRRIDRLGDLKAKLDGAGISTESLALDITQEEDIVHVVSEVEDKLGPITTLINNAGMNNEGLAIDISADDFDQLMATNVRGPFLMAREVARKMIAAGRGGQIINIASVGAFAVLPGLTPYCTSKAAVAHMTKALAREWARANIQVNAVCPGYIETEINTDWFASEGGQRQVRRFPRRRLGNESDLDGMMLLLADPASRFITGSVLTVDDGQSLAGV